MVRTERAQATKVMVTGDAEAQGVSGTAFAPTSREEREVVARINADTGLAHISASWAAYSRRLGRLYGPPGRVTRDCDGHVTTCFWEVPASQVTFRRFRKPSQVGCRQAPPVGGGPKSRPIGPKIPGILRGKLADRRATPAGGVGTASQPKERIRGHSFR